MISVLSFLHKVLKAVLRRSGARLFTTTTV